VLEEQFEKVFLKKTVKPITDFDAKHLKGGGFRENTFSEWYLLRECPWSRRNE